MNKESYFINISRDKLIKKKDFLKFIAKKRIQGVGIDNTGSFKMEDKVYFNKKKNFILTNHQAGISTNYERRKLLIYKNLENFYYKKKLIHQVSKTKGY